MRLITIKAFLVLFVLSSCAPDDLVSNGPLANRSDNKYFRFSDYAPLKTNRSDAIRVIVAPSFGIYHYRFDLVPLNKGCRVLDYEKDFDKQPASKMCGDAIADAERSLNPAFRHSIANEKPMFFKFIVPAPEYQSFFNTLKSKMKGWRGAWQQMTDGTGSSIEIHDGVRITSYHSNLPLEHSPDNPAAFASLNMRTIALAYAPAGLIPRDPDWNVRPPDKELQPRFRCAWPGLNVPDPDGWGFGDDACAKTRSAN